jgi:superfamily II DNA/RNA helicase
MTSFEGFGLNPALAQSLARMNYTTPTPIQAQAIPFALKGRDIMGTAQTGTGKTAAFAIPLVESLLRSPQGSALVLTPTRELGRQIMDIIQQLLGPQSPIKTAFLIGGESMGKQLAQLRQRPRIIVGTPGRINDHLQQGTLKLRDAGFLVLDETDRMLDMGFTVQIDRILKHLPAKRQTLMFSATMPPNILKLSGQYLNNPERVAVGSTAAPAQKIKQETIRVSDGGKYEELVRQLDARAGSIIVFVRTKYGADKLARKLDREDFAAEAIHGDLKQNRRDRVIREFRAKEFRILVATDVAARGLDIPHIEHVINYDPPQVAEDYIHRIGRTARAGAEGSALCLISAQDDAQKWRAVERLMNPGQNPQPSDRKQHNQKTDGRKAHDQKGPGNNNHPGDKSRRRKRRFYGHGGKAAA